LAINIEQVLCVYEREKKFLPACLDLLAEGVGLKECSRNPSQGILHRFGSVLF
jgi:hypothetical protein